MGVEEGIDNVLVFIPIKKGGNIYIHNSQVIITYWSSWSIGEFTDGIILSDCESEGV